MVRRIPRHIVKSGNWTAIVANGRTEMVRMVDVIDFQAGTRGKPHLEVYDHGSVTKIDRDPSEFGIELAHEPDAESWYESAKWFMPSIDFNQPGEDASLWRCRECGHVHDTKKLTIESIRAGCEHCSPVIAEWGRCYQDPKKSLLDHLQEAQAFAENVGADRTPVKLIKQMVNYGPVYRRVKLYWDFAPMSFAFDLVQVKSGETDYSRVYNGGLIYHGPGAPGDGSAPSLSVDLDYLANPGKHNWGIHT